MLTLFEAKSNLNTGDLKTMKNKTLKTTKSIILNGTKVQLRHTKKMASLIKAGGYNTIEYIADSNQFKWGGSVTKLWMINNTNVRKEYTLNFDSYQYDTRNMDGCSVNYKKSKIAMVLDIINFSKSDLELAVKQLAA
jgi:hypothetical protein